MTPETLADLYGYGIDENTSLELEFFFYTDTLEKAEALEKALKELGYSAESSEHEYDEEKLITGRTTPLQMRADILTDWTVRMCELGFRHDCEFDGWGAATAE
jgi:regulator of RNase E activity RraB